EFTDPGDVNPALGAEPGVAHGKNGDEGRDAEEIQERSLVQDQVIVHARARTSEQTRWPASAPASNACPRANCHGWRNRFLLRQGRRWWREWQGATSRNRVFRVRLS